MDVRTEQLNVEALKAEIHRILISRIDLEKLAKANPEQGRNAVSGIVSEILD